MPPPPATPHHQMATLSYSLDNPIIVKINQLWKDQFNIDELQTTLVHLQNNRAKSNSTHKHVQNELDKIVQLSSSIDRKTQTIEAELPQLMKQVEKLESHVMAVDKQINTCSIQCNEYRLNDPAKIQSERLLRLATEEEKESRKIKEDWETKVSKGRNQRNRAKSKRLHDAQTKAMEIEKYRARCSEAKMKRKKFIESQHLLEKNNKKDFDRLVHRNMELQTEYEQQLKEEEVLNCKIGRMDDFLNQNAAVEMLLNEY